MHLPPGDASSKLACKATDCDAFVGEVLAGNAVNETSAKGRNKIANMPKCFGFQRMRHFPFAIQRYEKQRLRITGGKWEGEETSWLAANKIPRYDASCNLQAPVFSSRYFGYFRERQQPTLPYKS
ncbi:hypothetical protein OUZ56_008225 [Daphnia magna]|uniref:Uncharacterized protein n=1 Tax=Daphnia magna TaxID=35525 RepID=A0ABR0ACC1_9CRUS|nr:hypothetical protein OUZ56_008225 [Daphnia magna]